MTIFWFKFSPLNLNFVQTKIFASQSSEFAPFIKKSNQLRIYLYSENSLFIFLRCYFSFSRFSPTQNFQFFSETFERVLLHSVCYLLITAVDKEKFCFNFHCVVGELRFTRRKTFYIMFKLYWSLHSDFFSLQVVHLLNLVHIQRLKQLSQAYTVAKLCP